MSRFLKTLNRRILVMDGAMGTQLMNGGVLPEDCFDLQNLERPKLVKSIHQSYVQAGADIIETNTFGANAIKLKDYKLDKKVAAINIAAAKIARLAMGKKGFVCGSIGPLGKLIDPLGEVTFDQAYQAFAEQAKALQRGGVDLLCVETISDLQEMRAAIIAIKNNTQLPVVASLTYDEAEKTIYGTPPGVALVVLESLGVDIIAANCSTGPKGMLKVARKLLAASCKPIMVMPNAGMPELIDDQAVYKMTPKQFGSYAAKFAQLGVRIVGGCCGTTPEHIQAVKSKINLACLSVRQAGRQAGPKSQDQSTKFASRTKVVVVPKNRPLLVGERINPTGRKLFAEEIRAGKTQVLRLEAKNQTKAGADLLDVNISTRDIIEAEVMHQAVKVVQSNSELPFSIDSPNVAALESGLKAFSGRALLNSVNAKKESLTKVLPLAKKYGAAIIALTIDDAGLAATAADRLRIAKKIVQAAKKIGLAKEDIFVDNLVMTAGVGIEACLEALKAIPIIKQKLGVRTILGISNVSHGMPNRSKLNALYFQLAVSYGLDAAIVDVTDLGMRKALKAVKGKKALKRAFLLKQFKSEVEKARRSGKPAEKKREASLKEIKFSDYQDIKAAVIDGNSEAVEVLVHQAIEKKYDPQKVINQGLVPGMEVVGKKFSRNEYFLPQVIESAEAMKQGFGICKQHIPQEKSKSKGKVILATVKGDIHDIGKNIVRMLLENHGFTVVDLGKDVPTEEIVKTAKRERPKAIALSALLTTTMVEMGVVKDQLTKANLDIPLLVGGAVVSKGYADRIGANYSMDAVGAVSLVKKIIKAAS